MTRIFALFGLVLTVVLVPIAAHAAPAGSSCPVVFEERAPSCPAQSVAVASQPLGLPQEPALKYDCGTALSLCQTDCMNSGSEWPCYLACSCEYCVCAGIPCLQECGGSGF